MERDQVVDGVSPGPGSFITRLSDTAARVTDHDHDGPDAPRRIRCFGGRAGWKLPGGPEDRWRRCAKATPVDPTRLFDMAGSCGWPPSDGN